jgi:hypothetical protein
LNDENTPERGVGEAEARIERVARVVAEGDGAGPALALLRLEAVRVVEPALQRVTSGHLREADGEVVRLVDVQIPGNGVLGGAFAMREPHAKAGGIEMRVPSQITGLTPLQRLEGEVVGIDHAGIGKSIGSPARPALAAFAMSFTGTRSGRTSGRCWPGPARSR